jgi:hypothetical protein
METGLGYDLKVQGVENSFDRPSLQKYNQGIIDPLVVPKPTRPSQEWRVALVL